MIHNLKKLRDCSHIGMLYISMGIRKKEMTTATHGTAMEAPCVGPQERPKGEYAQDRVISNAERNRTRYLLVVQ